jgi:hypothetical protein
VIKEEFVALTGDNIKALVLNQFIYWSERVKDFDKFILEERVRAEQLGESSDIELTSGWINKTTEELGEELMIKLAPKNLRNHINELVENGWLDRRNNPHCKWDKTFQYRVNLIKVHLDLLKIGYLLQDYKIDMSMVINPSKIREYETYLRENESYVREYEMDLREDKTSDRKGENVPAIPEITIETTLKNTTEYLLFEKAKENLKNQMTDVTYNTWITPIDYIGFKDNTFILKVDSDFSKGIIEARYKSQIEDALSFLNNGPAVVRITTS